MALENELSIHCSEKGIKFEKNDKCFLFQFEDISKLQFALKSMKPKSVGKIFRISDTFVCTFTFDHICMSNEKTFIKIKYDKLKFICESISENIMKCVFIPKHKLDNSEKILIQNFKTLFVGLEEDGRRNILNVIKVGNERVTYDIAKVVMKSSEIPTKNPYICQFIHTMLTRNLSIFEMLHCCLKIKNQ